VIKRAIAQAAKGEEVDFEALLREECGRVSARYTATWCVHALLGGPQRSIALTPWPHGLDVHGSDKLDAALDTLERSVEGRGDGDGEVARPVSPVALAAAQRVLVTTVVPELGLLRLFVVLNYTAVVKARAASGGPTSQA
jgi:hypothetical protein